MNARTKQHYYYCEIRFECKREGKRGCQRFSLDHNTKFVRRREKVLLNWCTVDIETQYRCWSEARWISCQSLESSPKMYLLVGRKEQLKKGGSLKTKGLHFRKYLEIEDNEHRKALKRMILLDHKLAIERLRWRTPSIPQEDCLCRLCIRKTETPEHMLLECTAQNDICSLRRIFTEDVLTVDAGLGGPFDSEVPNNLLKLLISQSDMSYLLGKLAFDITRVYYDRPMYEPDGGQLAWFGGSSTILISTWNLY